MRNEIIMGLDFGSSKIAAALGRMRRDEEYARQSGEFHIIDAALYDRKPPYGSIDDAHTTASVTSLIYNLSKRIGAVPKRCLVGMSASRFSEGENSKLDFLNSLGIKVKGVMPSPIAAARAILSQDEQRSALLLDIGASGTGTLVYADGAILFFELVPMGGASILRGLSEGLSVGFDIAKKLLLKYGCADASCIDEDEPAVLKDENRKNITLSRRRVCELIEEKFDAIIRQVKERLAQFDKDYSPSSIVVTGGLSQMDEAVEKVERSFNAPTRLGMTKNAAADDISFKGPLYSAAAGLAMACCDEEEGSFIYRQDNKADISNIWSKARFLYNEYF